MADRTERPTDVTAAISNLNSSWFGESAAPLMFRAVGLEAWDTFHQLLAQRSLAVVTKELRFVDSYGYSALHYACWLSSTAPLNVVKMVIDHSPKEFVSMGNRKGRTPLHLAAWRGRDEVVEILAATCPEAISVMDKTHKTPLVDACFRNRSKRALEALIVADPSQILNEKHCQRTPANLFFRVSHGLLSVPQRTRFSNKDEQIQFTAKARVILSGERLALRKPLLDLEDDMHLLRAAIESSSCPFPFVKFILENKNLKRSRITDYRDEQGNTILQIALKAQPLQHEKFFKCDRCHQAARPDDPTQRMCFNRDPDKPHWGVRCCTVQCHRRARGLMLNYVVVNVVSKESAVIKYLVTKCLELARIEDSSGRMPLQVALEVGRTWHTGIQALVMANPTSISMQAKPSGLYPFHLAASACNETVTNSSPRKKQKVSDSTARATDKEHEGTNHTPGKLETIFHLLRESPDLVQPVPHKC